MVDSGRDGPRQQNNYGPGPFIGGDMRGDIRFEALDPKTKTVLAKLSKDAPDLAKLLRKALRDGVISPDVVAALQSAVQNINEDVASALMFAAQNINEDVANSLWYAGKNINADVANQISQAAETLGEARRELDYTLRSLNKTVNEVNGRSGLGHSTRLTGTIDDSAEPVEYAFTPSIPKIGIWKVRVKAFILGVAIGALTMFILIHAHVKPF